MFKQQRSQTFSTEVSVGYGTHKDIQTRQIQLEASKIEHYPRLREDLNKTTSPTRFKFFLGNFLKELELDRGLRSVKTIHARIVSIRTSGNKLAFLQLEQDGDKLQAILSYGDMQDESDPAKFKSLIGVLGRGDIVAIQGVIDQTTSGETSIRCTKLPELLAPCLHQFPSAGNRTAELSEGQRAQDRHVQMLLDPDSIKPLKIRALVVKRLRTLLENKGFTEVSTPILAASAGGANARPFVTSATEFEDRKLSLRIAPELWLKRLIVGGMPRVFEIGPSFRNEGMSPCHQFRSSSLTSAGLDKTHNPEFTTCEFYGANLNLGALVDLTQQFVMELATIVRNKRPTAASPDLFSKDEISKSIYNLKNQNFQRIDFIPALEETLQKDIPALDSADALRELLVIFENKSLEVPSNPTIPRLLDTLSTKFLEPRCIRPTWIIHYPECMSPLSKSFVHPGTSNTQKVAARAELFIDGLEYVNCYEEENSPFEQRRKFENQQETARSRDGQIDDEAMHVDEDYIRALEWGMPPTGGWGCGIDRFVMLLAGKDKIGEVLSFGNLRAVTRGAERFNKGEVSDIDKLAQASAP